MAPAGVGETVLQPAIGRQQQQALAVGIEATGGIDAGMINPVGQAAPSAAWLPAELAENPVGLMEEEGVQGRARESDAAAGTPEIDDADRDQQQSKIHREGRQNHGQGSGADHPKARS